MRSEVIEARINPCALAECALAFEAQGLEVKSKSALVAACVQSMADVLKTNGVIVSVEDADAADMILKRVLGKRTLDTSSLTFGNLKQQVEEAAKQFNSTGD